MKALLPKKIPLGIAKFLCQILDDKLAKNIALLKIPQLSSVADYFIVATATSCAHLDALQHHLRNKAGARGLNHHRGVEGKASSRWRLIDFGSVVVHLMDEDSRRRYRLDELWNEARKIQWRIPSKKSKLR